MTRMNNKLAIKENFDEGDLSDDVDDEVFVRDGKKNMVKIDKQQKCDEQPLMPARKKPRQRPNSVSPEVRSRQPCNIYNCLLPVYFAVAAIISIAFLMLLYVFLVDKVPVLMSKFGWWSSMQAIALNDSAATPCNDFKLNRVWGQKIPKLLSDSQIKLVDIDRDGIEDVIIGTGTEMQDAARSERSCDHEYNSMKTDKCLGGVIALNGKTGSMLWKLWLTRMVLAVHCDFEITGDGVPDCLVTGKSGLMILVSGAEGVIIWEHNRSASNYDLYNALIIGDVNYDGHKDILTSYYTRDTMDPNLNHRSSILVISGKHGDILHQFQIPAFEAILHAPQIIYNDMDGSEIVIFVTGGPEHPGGLYAISMSDLLRDDPKPAPQKRLNELLYMKTLFHFDTGILAAPIMADLNLDGISDIIFLTANTTFAVDGLTFRTLWNTSLYDYAPKMYSILSTSSVTPTYFNNDDVPDLLIMFSVGDGYPAYFYSVIIILNGKNGQSLTKGPIIRSGVADTVGNIALSFSGMGNDAFLFWVSTCKNHVASDTPYKFLPDENRQFFIDLCELRFNSTSQLQMFALNQHVEPPGILLKTESWHESWNYDVRDDLDATNEQATLYYRINSQDQPQTYRRPPLPPPEPDNVDDGQYSDGSENIPTSWKVRKNGYRNNGPPVVIMNDIPEQSQNVDYEPGSDILMNNGRNEKEYDIPRANDGLRMRRDVNIPNSADSANKMLPKVSASGVLTQSLDSNTPIDLILMHYEVLAKTDECIFVDKQRRCSNVNSRPKGHQQNFRENAYVEKVPPMSNLFISRYQVTCDCVNLGPEEHVKKCSKMLPYSEQSFPAYMGRYGNSAFKSRYHISSASDDGMLDFSCKFSYVLRHYKNETYAIQCRFFCSHSKASTHFDGNIPIMQVVDDYRDEYKQII